MGGLLWDTHQPVQKAHQGIVPVILEKMMGALYTHNLFLPNEIACDHLQPQERYLTPGGKLAYLEQCKNKFARANLFLSGLVRLLILRHDLLFRLFGHLSVVAEFLTEEPAAAGE